MRELHDCRTEVFRRSEERIQARKKRRTHILMTCIPLVLCVSMAGALHFHNRNHKSAPPEAIADGANDVNGHNDVIRIQVTGENMSLYHTDPRAIQDILLQLDSRSGVTAGIVLDEPEVIPEGIADDATLAPTDVPRDSNDHSAVRQESTQYAATIGYTITVILEDGSTHSYYLSGNTLEDLAKNETYPLTQAELTQLKNLLGVS